VQPASAPPDPGGYGVFLLETLLILALVCVGAWLVIRIGVRRLYAGGAARGGPLRVVARLPLEPRRTVYIVEAAGKMLLLGASDQGPLAILAELDRDRVEAAVGQLPTPTGKTFLDLLRKKDPPKA
jgi:flagellar biogenesis protein FliO